MSITVSLPPVVSLTVGLATLAIDAVLPVNPLPPAGPLPGGHVGPDPHPSPPLKWPHP